MASRSSPSGKLTIANATGLPKKAGAEALGGGFQGRRLAVRQRVEILHPLSELPIQRPFAREGVGQLEHLDVVEGLFQDDQLVGGAQLGNDAGPAVIRVGGAQDDLQILVRRPEPPDRLDPVPTRGDAHIDKRERVGPARAQGLQHPLKPFLALLRPIHLKRRTGHRGRRRAKESLVKGRRRPCPTASTAGARILRKSS